MGATWNSPETRRTQADKRKEDFNKTAQIARALADLALEEIDAVLAEPIQHSELFEICVHDESAHNIVG